MQTEEGVRGPFRPTKTIVLSELSTRERELYYSLLVANNAKFYRDEEGRYIGNERLTKLKNEGFIDVTLVAPEHLEYNAYPRFTALIANNGDTVRPRQRPFTWVMKIVEDIFDHRFSLEKNDIEREDESPSFDLMLLIFPVFVVRKIGTNVGLKTIVDQTCWDLLYNVNLYRKDYLELEVFGRFLQEFYDHDDLLFFLYVRSVLAKVLHISFKARWQKKFDGVSGQPKALWISYKEAAHVARIVFGSDNEGLFRDFMRLITPQMVGEKTASGDSRRIDITEYLHLSVVGYHQSQTQQKQNQEGRMLVPIPGQLAPMAPAPMPTGLTFEGSQQGHSEGQEGGDNHHGGQGHDQYQGQQGNGTGEGNNEGEEDYYSFDYPPAEQGAYTPYNYDQQQQQGGDSYGAQGQGFDPYAQQRQGMYSGDSYEDPYDAVELTEGLDLQSLASSLIGRIAAANNAQYPYNQSAVDNNYHQNDYNEYNDDHHHQQDSSNYLHSEDIPFDRSSMGFTEISPRQSAAAAELNRERHGLSDAEEPDYLEEEPEEGQEELNPFELLQAERESEFLGALIEPLSALPEEYAQYATNDLGDRLRQTVQIFLQDKDIPDLASLDAILRDFLSLDALRSDMESFRDEIIDYYMQDDGAGGEGEGEGEGGGDYGAEMESKERGGAQ
eukprot:gene19429-22088_t